MLELRKKLDILWNKESFIGYFFVMPNLIGFLLFTSIPVAASLILSFASWDIFSPPRLIWFENFVSLFLFHVKEGFLFESFVDYIAFWNYLIPNDGKFWYFMYNTTFMMLGIPLGMIASLCLALVMNRQLRGIMFFRTIYFLPSVSSAVALAILWKWIYNLI